MSCVGCRGSPEKQTREREEEREHEEIYNARKLAHTLGGGEVQQASESSRLQENVLYGFGVF